MTSAMGTATGRDILRQTVAAVWADEPPGTLYLTLNATIDDSGEEPSVTDLLRRLGDDDEARVAYTRASS